MTYVYWFIIAGLVWNCVYFSRANREQLNTIADQKRTIADLVVNANSAWNQYQELKAKIVKKAEVVEHLPRQPKKYTGPQLRVLNDRLNAQQSAELQERPNSEILKEQVNG